MVGSTLSSELADRARILLPCNMLHAPTTVLREMCKRYNEYVQPMTVRVAVGTYNVNGGKHFRSVVFKDTLSDWLLDCHALARSKALVDVNNPAENASKPVDIFAIGFEEIVDLNASNIMAASTENSKLWAEELQKTISRDNDYVLLTYQQLVGVCLYIYIRPEHASYVRDVAIDCVKTGLGGATGNKGACAIRFVFHGTSMCFVCAHFAAGQSQVSITFLFVMSKISTVKKFFKVLRMYVLFSPQVAERNADYAEITRKLAFPMGRTLKSHDWVFWCGDFNYRIDMDKEELKEAIRNGDLASVLENDQLLKEQEAGNVFTDFLEGEITFDPTYKYDVFSDDYDTSEKQRAPAWTDRVLWRRRKALAESDHRAAEWNPGKLIHYGRSELKQSDHRPVIAIIDAEIISIDQRRRREVFEQVIKDLGPPDCTIVVHVHEPSTEEDGGPTIYDENVMSTLIQELSKLGEVTLVRYVDDTMWVTFRDGESALNAVAKGDTSICDLQLKFELKTPNWSQYVDDEIELCTTNTIPLCANPKEQAQLLNATPEIPQRPKQPPARPAPARPPIPMSPKNSPRHLPHAGVISVVPEMLMQSKPAKPLMPPQPQQPPQLPPPLRPVPVNSAVGGFDTPSSSKSQSPTEHNSPLHSSSGKGSPVGSGSAASSLPPTPPRHTQSKNVTPVSTPSRQSKQSSVDVQDTASTYNDSSNIYEEIQDDIPAPRHPPPPFPPVSNENANESPARRRPPALPANAPSGPPPPPRRPPALPANAPMGPPPPIPNRQTGAPPLPNRPNNN